MGNVGHIAILGMIFGMIGTSLGGVCGALLNIKSNKFVSFILEFSSGLMTAVICFDLIPESLKFVTTRNDYIWNIIRSSSYDNLQ